MKIHRTTAQPAAIFLASLPDIAGEMGIICVMDASTLGLIFQQTTISENKCVSLNG
ncbi:hypothetical protein [Parabacteroides sp. AM08-6]|uniref:hypothetical protein n=1 Tax=Parabacteroides sp. AM08-6 TaxID=2292053 RepID=UPI00131490C6|nr:hypothetical protein [Parabacteroides sp. AM08-6]